MFVPCPHCGFLVALSAGGEADRQPCPRCGGALEDDAAGAAPVADAATSKQPVPPAAAVKSPAAKSPAGRGARVATPAFARRRAPDGGRRGQAWSWLAVAVLGVLLALQLFLAQRAQLAADAGTRRADPSVRHCRVFGARLHGAAVARALRLDHALARRRALRQRARRARGDRRLPQPGALAATAPGAHPLAHRPAWPGGRG